MRNVNREKIKTRRKGKKNPKKQTNRKRVWVEREKGQKVKKWA